jgi:hypothetical protein
MSMINAKPIKILFCAYMKTQDKAFSLYVTTKQQDYEDKTNVTTSNKLMEDTLRFYQTRE